MTINNDEKVNAEEIKLELAVGLLEEFHSNYNRMDAYRVVKDIIRIANTEVNTCYFCGHVGIDVKRVARDPLYNYEELVENLNRLSTAGMSLSIVPLKNRTLFVPSPQPD